MNDHKITQDGCIKSEIQVTKFLSNPIKFKNITHLLYSEYISSPKISHNGRTQDVIIKRQRRKRSFSLPCPERIPRPLLTCNIDL